MSMGLVQSSRGDGCMVIPCPECGNRDCQRLGTTIWQKAHGTRYRFTCMVRECNYRSERYDTEEELIDGLAQLATKGGDA